MERAVDQLIVFTRRFLTDDQMRGLVRGISRSKGREVVLSFGVRTRGEAENYLRDALDEEAAASYHGELQRRLRAGESLVERSLIPARPQRDRGYTGPARNADEFEERQRDAARNRFWRSHDRSRDSARYATLRQKRLAVAGHRCETCGSTRSLQLHHVHYETLGSERVEDVRILCGDCHAKETERQRAIRRARWRRGPSTRGPRRTSGA